MLPAFCCNCPALLLFMVEQEWAGVVWVSLDVYKPQRRKLSMYSAECGGGTCWA